MTSVVCSDSQTCISVGTRHHFSAFKVSKLQGGEGEREGGERGE